MLFSSNIFWRGTCAEAVGSQLRSRAVGRTSFWVAAKGSEPPDLAALPDRTGETESLSNSVLPSSIPRSDSYHG